MHQNCSIWAVLCHHLCACWYLFTMIFLGEILIFYSYWATVAGHSTRSTLQHNSALHSHGRFDQQDEKQCWLFLVHSGLIDKTRGVVIVRRHQTNMDLLYCWCGYSTELFSLIKSIKVAQTLTSLSFHQTHCWKSLFTPFSVPLYPSAALIPVLSL